ncbi:hypothetical protein Tco_0018000 [Tanacetum coccineum]
MKEDEFVQKKSKKQLEQERRTEKVKVRFAGLGVIAIKLILDLAFLPQWSGPCWEGVYRIRDQYSKKQLPNAEVVGKGKAVVTEEQVAHSLIDLSKKKRTTDQFILVRRDQSPHEFKQLGPLLNLKMTHQRNRLRLPLTSVWSSIHESDLEKHIEALLDDPEPMKGDQTGSDSGKINMCLLLDLTLEHHNG